jgi:hypothetical protein
MNEVDAGRDRATPAKVAMSAVLQEEEEEEDNHPWCLEGLPPTQSPRWEVQGWSACVRGDLHCRRHISKVGGSRMVSVCARCIAGGTLEALWQRVSEAHLQRREDPKESKRVGESACERESKREGSDRLRWAKEIISFEKCKRDFFFEKGKGESTGQSTIDKRLLGVGTASESPTLSPPTWRSSWR